jgi:hypothetical protein
MFPLYREWSLLLTTVCYIPYISGDDPQFSRKICLKHRRPPSSGDGPFIDEPVTARCSPHSWGWHTYWVCWYKLPCLVGDTPTITRSVTDAWCLLLCRGCFMSQGFKNEIPRTIGDKSLYITINKYPEQSGMYHGDIPCKKIHHLKPPILGDAPVNQLINYFKFPCTIGDAPPGEAIKISVFYTPDTRGWSWWSGTNYIKVHPLSRGLNWCTYKNWGSPFNRGWPIIFTTHWFLFPETLIGVTLNSVYLFYGDISFVDAIVIHPIIGDVPLRQGYRSVKSTP